MLTTRAILLDEFGSGGSIGIRPCRLVAVNIPGNWTVSSLGRDFTGLNFREWLPPDEPMISDLNIASDAGQAMAVVWLDLGQA